MRYECDDPEFEGAFVEFSERWSVRQRRALMATANDGESLVALLASKIEAVFLPVVEGEPITEQAQFNPDDLERIDICLFEWVKRQMVQVLLDLAELGEAYRRRLYGTSGEKAEAE